jgi:peroxiredoxin
VAKRLSSSTAASAGPLRLQSGLPERQRLADRLARVSIPSVALTTSWEASVDLRLLALGFPLVVYTFPGSECSPEDGGDAALMDGLQHRAFRDHQLNLEARGYRAVGISSQTSRAQRRVIVEDRLAHLLLSDPGLLLAKRLGLPTFLAHGVGCYRRLTLIVGEGRIEKVFFPVSSAAHSAAQVIAWMTLQGIG